jgi:hypothetical protein
LSKKKNLGKRIDEAIEKAGGPQAVRKKMGIAIPSGKSTPSGKMRNIADPSNMTTIAISRTNQNCLNAMRKGFEDYDSIVTRLISGGPDIYTELIGIDAELPCLHTCILQLGEDAKKYHYWNGENWREISFEDANKMMKQPKPNITLTRTETQQIISDVEELSLKCAHNVKTELYDKLIAFLESQPSDAGKRDP